MKISRSAQSCALGACIAGAVAAGKKAGGYDNFDDAQTAMCAIKDITFKPIPKNVEVYKKLYKLYKQLHDALGVSGHTEDLSKLMKELLNIKDSVTS